REPRRRGGRRGEPAQAAREHPAARRLPGGGHQQLPHRPPERAPGHQGDRGGTRTPARGLTAFRRGGRGAIELAEAVSEAAAEPSDFRFLYPDTASLREKIAAVATKVYGADDVSYSSQAVAQLDTYERAGFGHLPVCIAKTHLSISSDPTLKGAPTGWTLPVREVRASVGAGFVYPIC